jgi:hypothetical protein
MQLFIYLHIFLLKNEENGKMLGEEKRERIQYMKVVPLSGGLARVSACPMASGPP